MLKVIISPAKQMRVDRDGFSPRGVPVLSDKSASVVEALRAIERERGESGLKALWNVSDRLLRESVDLLHAFDPISDEGALDDPLRARRLGPAVFSYVGIQYRSMAPEVLDLDALEWLQGHLVILSALYGCVRPFDAVQPYRLEMAARLAVGDARNLYEFWGSDLARAICGETGGCAEGGDGPARRPGPHAPEPVTVVNLASVEYAKAVLPHLPVGVSTVTCLFGEGMRDGKPIQRATASKIARGSMVRWMAERGIEDAADLRGFDVGYGFESGLSRLDGPERVFVFMRR